MRVDHHAFQRAATTSLTGLILQFAVATILLVFGLITDSTAFIFASMFVWVGVLVWFGLIILFYQEKMKALESLEESELVGDEQSSIFATGGDEVRPASSRLKLIHKWVMPTLSVSTALFLILIGLYLIRFLNRLNHQDDLAQTFIQLTPHIGWALATTMAFSLTCFIYSRFIAGMAKVQAWSNLRGGSAWMVGNAAILLALSIGLVFRFFGNDEVLRAICWAIPIFMFAVSAEILVNFVLNLYRPRLHGESQRPAFDSKTLSLFASPDSVVRSINEAINYQFGFDITSSWGYQLFVRSAIWLVSLGVAVLLLMSSIVIVEPNEQAVRTRLGAIIGEVHLPGPMFKLPWPLEKAVIENVSTIRTLPLTFTWKNDRQVVLWTDDYNQLAVTRPSPFLVNDAQGAIESVSDDLLSLVDIRAVLQYRVSEAGLLHWLQFGSDDKERRSRKTIRELAILAVSQNTLTEMFQHLQLDSVLGKERANLSTFAKRRIQKALDALQSGIEVVAVDLPLISPSGDAAGSFEELSVAIQGEALLTSAAEGQAQAMLTRTIGNPDLVDQVISTLQEYNDARKEWENASKSSVETSLKLMHELETQVSHLIEEGNGYAAAQIRTARVRRWTTLMGTWSRASRVSGQNLAYEASPNLYMQRMYMSVLARKLPSIKKYVIGIDPERLDIEVELQQINPLLNFSDSIDTEGAQ